MIFVPDSFKGTLESIRVIEILEIAAKKIFPESQIISIPMADGGEGTLDAILKHISGKIEYLEVNNPLFEKVLAKYGIINDDTAIIEMAQASGIMLVEDKKRNPMLTTTYGTGELIAHVLNKGYRKIIIGIGGSATNDGGMGAMEALGVRFFDKNGNLLRGTGENLINISKIDISNLNKLIFEAEFKVICDVKNPFTGENGAANIYGRQKGASDIQLKYLERGMMHYEALLKKQFEVNLSKVEGSGAAGGLGGALYIFLKAKLQSGIDIMLDISKFDELAKDVDVIITGEGKLDKQSSFGKVVAGIGEKCKGKNIPVIALVGAMDKEAELIYEHGIESIMTCVNDIMTLEYASKNAEELLLSAAERLFRILKIGINIGEKNI